MVRFVTFILACACAIAAAVSATAVLSGWIWLGAMITPFRLQILLASCLLLGLCLLTRQRMLILAASGVALSCLFPVGLRLAERPVLPAHTSLPTQSVSLVFANVLCDNRHYDAVTERVRAQSPDLFLAAETTPAWIDHLDTLKDIYPYSFAPRDLGIFGLSIYARRPFTAHVLRVGPQRMPLVIAEFSDLKVLLAHPLPPRHRATALANEAYIETLVRLARQSNKPVIVAGDFNATLWSGSMRSVLQAGLQWPNGSGVAYTWPSDKVYMAIQIDQVLTTKAVAGRYRVLPAVGSDHFPIRADLAFPQQIASQNVREFGGR